MGKYINIPKVELLGNDGHLTLEKLNICDSSDGNRRARWKKKRLKPRGSNNGKGFLSVREMKCYDVSGERISNNYETLLQPSHIG